MNSGTKHIAAIENKSFSIFRAPSAARITERFGEQSDIRAAPKPLRKNSVDFFGLTHLANSTASTNLRFLREMEK